MMTSVTGACTLHLYAPPFSSCKIFCRETGRAREVPMCYHSIRGVKSENYDSICKPCALPAAAAAPADACASSAPAATTTTEQQKA